MNKQREALELALDAFENVFGKGKRCNAAIDAIKEALAEPEPWTPDDMAYRPGGLPMDADQEPVAWLSDGGDVSRSKRYMDEMGFICEPLYTSPPARKPLTDEQIDAEFNRETWVTVVFADGARGIALDKVTARDFARAIERAHGIGE